MNAPWSSLAKTIKNDGIAAILTVAELLGSGPREVGARMMINASGKIQGTIGGGRLEWQALAQAQRMIRKIEKVPTSTFYSLGPELGQCCGGAVTVLFEVFDLDDLEFVEQAAALEEESAVFFVETNPTASGAMRTIQGSIISQIHDFELFEDSSSLARYSNTNTPLWLYGAGNVGAALIAALSPLPFDVNWIDQRPDQLLPHQHSDIRYQISNDPVVTLNDCPEGAFVIVLTHSHSLDFDLCEKALKLNKFPYVGVIGSKTKAARFRSRLKSNGLDELEIAQLISPLGVPSIKGKEPTIVAASIVAQLLEYRECLVAKNPETNFEQRENIAHG